MRCFNADRGKSNSGDFVLKHFAASLDAAADRVEGMFSHQSQSMITSDLTVRVHDNSFNFRDSLTLDEHLNNFCAHARQFELTEYDIDVKKPLRLNDLWEDDPIGSAGPNVIDFNELPKAEVIEIQEMFKPFSDVIYPRDVAASLNASDIKLIKSRYQTNNIFKRELSKRKQRSKAIGEDFSSVQNYELVWLDFTIKLRAWALGKGYDSFIYSNSNEGNGEDSVITLHANQAYRSPHRYVFLEEKYLSEMPSLLKKVMTSLNKPVTVNYHALWGGVAPSLFWQHI